MPPHVLGSGRACFPRPTLPPLRIGAAHTRKAASRPLNAGEIRTSVPLTFGPCEQTSDAGVDLLSHHQPSCAQPLQRAQDSPMPLMPVQINSFSLVSARALSFFLLCADEQALAVRS